MNYIFEIDVAIRSEFEMLEQIAGGKSFGKKLTQTTVFVAKWKCLEIDGTRFDFEVVFVLQ